MDVKKTLVLVMIPFVIVSCQKPQDVYDAIILEQGFIPYRAPSASAGVGTLVRGNANQFSMFAPSSECFSDELNLTWSDAVTLPDSYKEFSVDFSADLSALTQNGNPTLELKADFKKVKSIDIKFGDASIETLNQLRFAQYYGSLISEDCKMYVNKIPFIVQGLKVATMSFTFKDETGGSIKLDSENLDQIVKIHAGVSFSIKNNMTLVITTPKYIGYRMAKLRPKDEGYIRLIAQRINKDGDYLYDLLRSWAALFYSH